jgi:hypothetical protein
VELVPLAHEAGRPVVATEVGGLTDEGIDYLMSVGDGRIIASNPFPMVPEKDGFSFLVDPATGQSERIDQWAALAASPDGEWVLVNPREDGLISISTLGVVRMAEPDVVYRMARGVRVSAAAWAS